MPSGTKTRNSSCPFPAVLVSRGISFYAFLLLSGFVTLAVHLSTKSRSREKNTGAAVRGLNEVAPAA